LIHKQEFSPRQLLNSASTYSNKIRRLRGVSWVLFVTYTQPLKLAIVEPNIHLNCPFMVMLAPVDRQISIGIRPIDSTLLILSLQNFTHSSGTDTDNCMPDPSVTMFAISSGITTSKTQGKAIKKPPISYWAFPEYNKSGRTIEAVRGAGSMLEG